MRHDDVVLACLWQRTREDAASLDVVATAAHRHLDDPTVDVRLVLMRLARDGLAENDGTRWSVAPSAVEHAAAMAKQMMREGFDDHLLRYADSPTCAAFCRQVYEVDFFQFDVVSTAQRAGLLRALALRPGASFADLGCALGTLTDGLSMPLNYPLMDAASLSIIEDWILQGAVEN